ncbi:MAG TPA: DUF2905 domain-containing protein [Candidatus Sulfotelmatobacter sp.]|nr:DUF2905 domain-containing protein [Candidatus Sulfotelmatobacter sp.]
MPDLGRSLVAVGLAIAAVGAIIWSGLGRSWLGRLPGDIHVRRGGTEIYFPIATCVLVSLALTLLLWLLRGRR